MTGHRMSSLRVARFCGQAPRLSEQSGSERAAAMGSAFHALTAGARNAEALLSRLTADERAEVESWEPPALLKYDNPGFGAAWCIYEDAKKEVAVGLDSWGFWADPADGGWCIPGHIDMGWAGENDEHDHVVVGDVKKTRWTTVEGPDSLQLHAYGRAWAMKNKARHYLPAIWIADEGRWWVGDWVDLQSARADELWSLIYYAATNQGEYARGPHCRDCYGRLACPAYALGAKELEPPPPGSDPVAFGKYLSGLRAARELSEAAEDNLRAMVIRGEAEVADANGMVWTPKRVAGRETVDSKRLRAELGDAAANFIKRGEPYERFEWRKP